MEQVKVYDHAGNEFLAPDNEAAAKAVESGQYFFEKPEESLAASLGLRPAQPVVQEGGIVMQKDGVDRLFVYDKNGKRRSMWAVDAKECVKTGEFFWSPPEQEALDAEQVAVDALGAEIAVEAATSGTSARRVTKAPAGAGKRTK